MRSLRCGVRIFRFHLFLLPVFFEFHSALAYRLPLLAIEKSFGRRGSIASLAWPPLFGSPISSPQVLLRHQHSLFYYYGSTSRRRCPVMKTVALSAAAGKAASGDASRQAVVIAGAGIVGTSTAFFLARDHGISRITLVDPTGTIAPAASGKAGGFLALDWNDGSPTQELTRRSFALHQQLADSLGADSIQYRRLTCAAMSVSAGGARGQKPMGAKLAGVEWAQSTELDDASPRTIESCRPLGDERTIAQVHPKLLCQRLWGETQRLTNGMATLVKGKVLSGVHDGAGQLLGARLGDQTLLDADALLFACGPWTGSMMKGIKYHSVVIPTDRVLSQSVFFSGCGDPEVYVRPDGTAYCTGFPDEAKVVTEVPGEEEVRPDAAARIVSAVREATGGTGNRGALSREPTIQQACYLPTTNDGIPVMGELPTEIAGGSGCYVAAGHTCWGILLGPASGECMASLMATGTTTACPVDLRQFSPKRLGRFQVVPVV